MVKKDQTKQKCGTCRGSGQVTCYECGGSGQAKGPDGKMHPCVRTVVCTDCGGSGEK